MQPPNLEYVALVVDDPDRSADVFERAFGLPRTEHTVGVCAVPMISVGQTALAFFRESDEFLGEGARRGVHHIGVAANDPVAAAKATGFACDGGVRKGLDGRVQVQLSKHATCGVRTRLVEPLGIAPAGSNIVERIDHLGVASEDNKAARRVFIEQLGCVYESEQTDSEVETISENFTSDTHPYVFHTRSSQRIGGLRVTFISVGDCELEFLQDLTSQVKADEARHDTAGNTRGDRSAIARFVAHRGAGLHHIALKTPDIRAALEQLEKAGHRMVDTAGRPGSRRAQIGFMHPSGLGGVLLHFVERKAL